MSTMSRQIIIGELVIVFGKESLHGTGMGAFKYAES